MNSIFHLHQKTFGLAVLSVQAPKSRSRSHRRVGGHPPHAPECGWRVWKGASQAFRRGHFRCWTSYSPVVTNPTEQSHRCIVILKVSFTSDPPSSNNFQKPLLVTLTLQRRCQLQQQTTPSRSASSGLWQIMIYTFPARPAIIHLNR